MAENEELDLGKSPRWRRVLSAVLDGKPAEEIAAVAVECLRRNVKALRKPGFWGRSPQVPLADLLDAVGGDPGETDQAIGAKNQGPLWLDGRLLCPLARGRRWFEYSGSGW